MQPARRFRALIGVIGVLLLIAVFADRLLPLIGASILASTLVISQWYAISTFTQTQENLSVTTTATTTHIIPGRTTEIAVTATLSEPATHPVIVKIEYGPGVDGPDDQLQIHPGEIRVETIHEVSFPVAGQFTAPQVYCIFESADGLVTETIPIDAGVSVAVEPPEPTNIHVGVGGRQVASAYGEHQSESTGSGIELAELREYMPGDSAGKIDWKATARLNEPHVREFEVQTDRQTHLIFDARKAMWTGPEGQTKLEYQREIALGIIEAAASAKDPVSLTIIDDRGIQTAFNATETAHNYNRLKRQLHKFQPEQHTESDQSTSMATTGPADARSTAAAVSNLGTEFAELLEPYFTDTSSYIERLSNDPLFEVLRRNAAKRSRRRWTLIFTDDTDPHRTIEAVKLATRNDGHATLFLTPTILFESDGLTNLGEAHSRYVEFEDFRQKLARFPRVTAYEVGPGDRLETVLSAEQNMTEDHSEI